MDGEKEANFMKASNSLDEVRRMVEDPAYARQVEAGVEAGVKEMEAEIESLGDEEETYEFADIDFDSLSEEELKAHVEVLDEQIEQAKKRIETNRRALNLGLLKKANQAPRCSHLKSNGEPCRAPAMGNRLFCVFHTRAHDTELEKEKIRIGVIENREGVQIAVKQIMEHIVSEKIDARGAALLLRAVQIAGSAVKSDKTQPQPAKSKRAHSESDERWGNAVENAG
jgi:hypothetical protein